MRIVSLVPSITETLFDFGLDESQVVGRTKFCIHPSDQVRKVQIIGGTKNLNLQKIKDLNPDLIIANKEENEQNQVEELMEDFRVWTTDIKNLEDNRGFITKLGQILGKEALAGHFNQKTDQLLAVLERQYTAKAAYLIWANPYMTVGNDTFIHDMLSKLGFENIFDAQTRYPIIEIEKMSGAEYLFLSSEPFPFKEKHAAVLQKQLPRSKIIFVDGEAFSWYGTHVQKCAAYFRNFLQKC